MTKLIPDLENHISYTACKKVNAICRPLFEHLEINFFQYVKQYYDGGRILLSSNKEWVKDYFEFEHYNHEYVNFGKNYPLHHAGFNIWSGCKQNHSACKIWLHSREKYNIDHILAIHSNHENYCELYHFGGKEKNHHLISVFLSNLELFQKFTLYFLEKGQNILKQANADPFYPPKNPEYEDNNRWLLGVESEDKNRFSSKIDLNRFYLKGPLEGQFLSYRQLECLKGIIEGKSYKEIAEDLNISNRTIEYHLSEIRKIFHVKSKRLLIEALHEHDIIPYMKFLD